MNESMKTLLNRRSVRSFRPEQLREEDLAAILKAGTYAPSAMGKQPAVMVVVQDEATRSQLSQMNAAILGKPGTDPFYGAPTVVVVLSQGGCVVEDGSLVMGNLMNAAAAIGGGLLLDSPGQRGVRLPGRQSPAAKMGSQRRLYRGGTLHPWLP